MITIQEIFDKNEKTNVSLRIMHNIPKWFSPPEDIDKKSITHRDYPFFAAYNNSDPIGFLVLKIHNEFTADIYNMGIIEDYHRQGIGTSLVGKAEEYCMNNSFKYLTVKTLDSSAVYEPYERTRNFYRKVGFIPLEVLTTFWDEENPCLFLAKHLECMNGRV